MSSNQGTNLEDIPYGSYCYTITEITGIRIKTKLCPHYQYLENGSVNCSFLGINNLYEDDFLLVDQCKICGENEFDEEFNLEES